MSKNFLAWPGPLAGPSRKLINGIIRLLTTEEFFKFDKVPWYFQAYFNPVSIVLHVDY